MVLPMVTTALSSPCEDKTSSPAASRASRSAISGELGAGEEEYHILSSDLLKAPFLLCCIKKAWRTPGLASTARCKNDERLVRSG